MYNGNNLISMSYDYNYLYYLYYKLRLKIKNVFKHFAINIF